MSNPKGIRAERPLSDVRSKIHRTRTSNVEEAQRAHTESADALDESTDPEVLEGWMRELRAIEIREKGKTPSFDSVEAISEPTQRHDLIEFLFGESGDEERQPWGKARRKELRRTLEVISYRSAVVTQRGEELLSVLSRWKEGPRSQPGSWAKPQRGREESSILLAEEADGFDLAWARLVEAGPHGGQVLPSIARIAQDLIGGNLAPKLTSEARTSAGVSKEMLALVRERMELAGALFSATVAALEQLDEHVHSIGRELQGSMEKQVL